MMRMLTILLGVLALSACEPGDLYGSSSDSSYGSGY